MRHAIETNTRQQKQKRRLLKKRLEKITEICGNKNVLAIKLLQ